MKVQNQCLLFVLNQYFPDYPYRKRLIKIDDFIEGHCEKTGYVVLSQCIMENNYNVIFAKISSLHTDIFDTAWKECSSYRALKKFIKNKLWREGMNVYSIAAEKNRFVCFGVGKG